MDKGYSVMSSIFASCVVIILNFLLHKIIDAGKDHRAGYQPKRRDERAWPVVRDGPADDRRIKNDGLEPVGERQINGTERAAGNV